MNSRSSLRGQPLMVLGLVLVGWIGLRSAMWAPIAIQPATLGGLAEPPLVHQSSAQSTIASPKGAGTTKVVSGQPKSAGLPDIKSTKSVKAHGPRVPITEPASTGDRPVAQSRASIPLDDSIAKPPVQVIPEWQPPAPPPPVVRPKIDNATGQISLKARSAPQQMRAARQNLLMAAGFASMPLPSEISALMLSAMRESELAKVEQKSEKRQQSAITSADRWSVDAWLLLRPDGVSSVAAGQSSYGRSQAGAVARFKLLPDSGHRPSAYFRTSAALEEPREAESALGLAARPVPNIPVSVAAEMRLSRFDDDYDLRPAAFAVTELPPAKLPLGLQGEVYAQAGYVGGDFATAFVDGQLRVDRKILQLDGAQFRAGAGSWGGAQKGAARLDIGPTASLGFRVGATNARVSADWRFRVAGDAAPDSGPALTLTAGF